MKIKALFVDLGGVLIINNAKEVGEKYQQTYRLTPEMTKKVFHFIHTAERSNQELEEFLSHENINQNVWKRFLMDFYATESRNDSLVELLKQAKLKGIFIVYTTNNSSKLIIPMQKYKIDNFADLIINSTDAGVAKPDQKFWSVSLNETKKLIPDIQPDEILVIDDSQTNCSSAQEFGLNSFRYTNDPNSIKKLSELVS